MIRLRRYEVRGYSEALDHEIYDLRFILKSSAFAHAYRYQVMLGPMDGYIFRVYDLVKEEYVAEW